jgi:hypothetical protein
MRYFAKLNEDNVVLKIIEKHDDPFIDDGAWQEFFSTSQLIETKPDGSIRKHFAEIGYTYSSKLDAFIPPKPYLSWILNESSYSWQAPKTRPADGKSYMWNELELSWKLIEFPVSP